MNNKNKSKMEKKQNSVEYLMEMIKLNNKDFYAMLFEDKVFEQAKAMHRKEIEEAYVYGVAFQIDIKNGLSPIFYYNDRFGGDK